MEVGLVRKIDIDEEMQQAYLDYAMSVIVARALPDARDGLKPVHRRILYAMYDMGLRTDSAYKKSARIVGEVLGKYHPHGDMAVYDAMARMAQSFSMRYPLVDGQGNFGSVDGDPPAAMRYTEARLAPPAHYMLADINKNTVDFEDNFDGTLEEPSVLPAALPNLLVNGATGIAVGMSTSVPPHNLGEVVDAIRYMLENWEKLDDVDVEDLMRFVQGPDFPTGGIIIQEAEGDGLMSAYGTGRGRVVVQARAHLEEMDRGRNRIIVTELPYMTNKATLIERIAELVRDERLEGIVDLRDESDRQGMRIVIELSKNADPEAMLRSLYKYTPMQSTFSVIMLALVDGEPRMLSLKQALRVYVEHRLEIVRRRSQYDLERARQRAHILEGLRVALKNLDEVISMIRKAPDVETARVRLMKRFKLTEIQAQAILDMPLRRLAALERKKIEDEYKEVQALIKELESLLRSPKKMRQVVGDELLAVKEAFGDARRTQIVHLKAGEKRVSLLTARDLTPEKLIWLAVTPEGLISRSPAEKQPRLVGKDAPAWLIQASTRDTLYLVCEQGEAAAVAIHTLPERENPAEGLALSKVSALAQGNRLAALFTLPPKGERPEEHFVITISRQGMIKKSALGELPGAASGTFILTRVNEGDRVGWALISNGQSEVLLATARGMAIRFSTEEVRPMGLVAAGVMGVKLQSGDEVVGSDLLPRPGEVFLLASDGNAKRVAVDQFPRQGRYGQGIQAWKPAANAQVVGMAIGKGSTRAILHLETNAPKTIRLDEAPLVSRAARGSQVIKGLKAGERITGLTVPRGVSGSGAGEPANGSGGPEDGGSGRTRSGGKTNARMDRPAGKSTASRVKTTGKDGAQGQASKGRSKSATGSSPVGKTGRKAGGKTAQRQAKAAPAESSPVTKTIGRRTKALTAVENQAKTALLESSAPGKPVKGRAKVSPETSSTATPPIKGRGKAAAAESSPATKTSQMRSKAAPAVKGRVETAGNTAQRRTKAAPAESSPATKTTGRRTKATPAESSPATKTTGRRTKAAPAASSTSQPTKSRAKSAELKSGSTSPTTKSRAKAPTAESSVATKTPGRRPKATTAESAKSRAKSPATDSSAATKTTRGRSKAGPAASAVAKTEAAAPAKTRTPAQATQTSGSTTRKRK